MAGRAQDRPGRSRRRPCHRRPLQSPRSSRSSCGVLFAVDGSAGSDKAVQQALVLRQEMRQPQSMELLLVNVQRPLPGDVSSFVGVQVVKDYHKERSDADLASARRVLAAAGMPHQTHTRVGVPGTSIAELARRRRVRLDRAGLPRPGRAHGGGVGVGGAGRAGARHHAGAGRQIACAVHAGRRGPRPDVAAGDRQAAGCVLRSSPCIRCRPPIEAPS